MNDTEKIDTENIDAKKSKQPAITDRNHWNVYRTRFLVRARQLSEPLLFTDVLGREQRGEAGDYLVESSDGFRSIAPRTIFEDIYVPLSGSELSPVRKGPENSAHAVRSSAAAGCERIVRREDRRSPAWGG